MGGVEGAAGPTGQSPLPRNSLSFSDSVGDRRESVESVNVNLISLFFFFFFLF